MRTPVILSKLKTEHPNLETFFFHFPSKNSIFAFLSSSSFIELNGVIWSKSAELAKDAETSSSPPSDFPVPFRLSNDVIFDAGFITGFGAGGGFRIPNEDIDAVFLDWHIFCIG